MRKAGSLAVGLVLMGTAAFAAGDGTVPETTNPAAQCKSGEVYHPASRTCVPADRSDLDDATRMEAARSLAFADRLDDAATILATLAAPQTSAALTLRGFVARLAGDWPGAKALYEAALARDPDNWQARSYLGQGYVAQGDSEAARAQLRLIRMTGGRGTWAEISLRETIATGAGFRY